MKPFVRLVPRSLSIATARPLCRACHQRFETQITVRWLATLPPNCQNEEPDKFDERRNRQLPETLSSPNDSNVTSTQQDSKLPQKYSQAYPSPPNSSQKSTVEPITSKDWKEIEAEIEAPPPLSWIDSDKPVPLNKDWPMSKADFYSLPNDEKARLVHEDWAREQHEYIKSEKLWDQTHLHPPGTAFKMPMVAYHRNYAPEGSGPPPVQEIPWQLKRPWNWVQRAGLGLVAGGLLATMVIWMIQHRDEFKLRSLEARNPAPTDWNDRARGFYALGLKHKEAGEMQLAAWALQRAFVEAGYQWVLEPEKIPEGQELKLNEENAYVVRTLMQWEIELEHWDKALKLMESLSTAYEENSPTNLARRSDLLRILALPAEKVKGVQAANEMYRAAISYAGLDISKDPNAPIVLDQGAQTSPFLLRALDDYMIFQIRNGLRSAKQALPTLLAIASVYRETPIQVRDVCGEGTVMLHIGEIMYALGHRDESLQWTLRAVETTRRALPLQKHEEERQRCSECIGNGCNSLGILHEVRSLLVWIANWQERGEFDLALDAFKMAIDMGIEMKNQTDVTRASNNFKRVANKLREHEENMALLEGRGIRLSR